MHVNDDPISQGFSKLDTNGILALTTASQKGVRGGNYLDLHIDVRLPQDRHSWGPVAGVYDQCEVVWVTQLRSDYVHFAA